MIEKFQDWVLKQDIHDIAYWATIGLYTSIMIATLVLNGLIFDNWYMIIIGTIVMNSIRNYSGGFHCSTLIRCVILTNALFIFFGFVASHTVDYYFRFILLGLLSIVWICYRTPVIETDYKDKSIKWHKCQAFYLCLIFFFGSLVYNFVGFELMANNMLWSLILVALLCFKNPKRSNAS